MYDNLLKKNDLVWDFFSLYKNKTNKNLKVCKNTLFKKNPERNYKVHPINKRQLEK